MSEKNKVEMHSETDSHVGHNEEAAVRSQMSKLNIEDGVNQNIKENSYKNKENNPTTENSSYKGRRIVHRSRNFDREISHNKNGYVGSPHKRGNANTVEEPPNWTPPRHVLAELEAEGVFSLKKKSIRFPKAKYFCRLCDYHCDTVEICRRHVADTRHRHLKELKTLESSLRNLLPPTEAQNEAITELIESVAEKYGITDHELEERKLIKIELEKLLQEVVPGASIEISGSTLSKFAIKSSNLDLDIVVPEETKPSIGLLAVLQILEQNDKYSDVFNDLSSSYPCMSFLHKKSGVSVVVGVSCPASRSTNRLLGYYNTLDSRVKPLVTAFRYWGKLCQLDDQHRGTLSAHCFPLMGVHFLQHTSPPVLPSLHALHSEKLSDQFITPDEIDPPWKSQNTSSIGELWVELFKFYSLTFKMSAYVINIRSTELLTRTERTWGKRMAIEDPFQTRRNLTRTVSCPSVFDYIATRFKTTYRYFVIPQMKFGFLFKQLEKEDKLDRKDSYEDEDETEEDKENNGDEDDEILNEELEDEDDDEESTSVEDVDEIKDGSSVLNDFEEGLKLPLKNLEKNEVNISLTIVSDHSSIEENEFNFNINDVTDSLKIIPCKVAKILMRQVQKEHLHYSFAEVNFTGGKTVPLFCSACQKSGHTKASCVEHELPPLKPLPKLKQSYYDLLSSIFFQMKNECAPTSEEINIRDFIVRELEEYIEQFFPGASLKLFGSSANGFGFGHSDLDICLTFKNHHTGEDIDHIKIIEEIAEKLKRFRQCRQVLAITTAKVPIVKFIIKRPLLEADLSLYNTLALQNTKLLRTYANMDHRVKILGYGMKYFAKLCDMGDASRGSLSSYAYILMVLHFLQQCHPPVLPVLQKLYNPKQPPPSFMIDGWNAWFYDDLTSIPKVWKDHGKNTARVGELWVHMLRYYTETFNWKDNVVTIRQLAPLTRLEKLWTTRCIAIEDPFDLSHNLGAGLSRKMNAFIMKAFIRGREMFGSGIEVPPMGYGYHSLVEYLFDTSQLTDGAPPNDRGCRWCGKIGHIVRDCPRKKQKKEKQKERKDTKKKTDKSPEKITEGKREKENGEVKTIQLGPEARDKMLERMGKDSTESLQLSDTIQNNKRNEKQISTGETSSKGEEPTVELDNNTSVKVTTPVSSGCLNRYPQSTQSAIESPVNLVHYTSSSPKSLQQNSKPFETKTITPHTLFQMANKLGGGTIMLPGMPPGMSRMPNLKGINSLSNSFTPILSHPSSRIIDPSNKTLGDEKPIGAPPGFTFPKNLPVSPSTSEGLNPENPANFTPLPPITTQSPLISSGQPSSSVGGIIYLPVFSFPNSPQNLGQTPNVNQNQSSSKTINPPGGNQPIQLQNEEHHHLFQLQQQQLQQQLFQQQHRLGLQHLQQQQQYMYQVQHFQARQHQQLHQPQQQIPHPPLMPMDGNSFISHFSQSSSGTAPQSMVSNLDGGMPPPPPGLVPNSLPQAVVNQIPCPPISRVPNPMPIGNVTHHFPHLNQQNYQVNIGNGSSVFSDLIYNEGYQRNPLNNGRPLSEPALYHPSLFNQNIHQNQQSSPLGPPQNVGSSSSQSAQAFQLNGQSINPFPAGPPPRPPSLVYVDDDEVSGLILTQHQE